jgi:hypothetical protein
MSVDPPTVTFTRGDNKKSFIIDVEPNALVGTSVRVELAAKGTNISSYTLSTESL